MTTTRTYIYGNAAHDKVLDARIKRGQPILNDGEILRVPLSMQDAATEDFRGRQRAARKVVDGSGESGLGLHRPGFRTTGNFAATRDERQQVRDEYETYITGAWRIGDARGDDPQTGFGENGPLGQVGTACTVRGGGGKYGVEGSPGTWRQIEGVGLVCVADDRGTDDAASVKDARERAYQMYDRELSQQWRNAR